jgi:hypothetical protein
MASGSPPTPTLLKIGMWLAAGFGGLLWLGLFGAATGCGHFAINGEVVSGADFLSEAGLAVAILGGLLLAAAYGIWTERTWSRHAVMGYWLYQLLFLEMLSSGAGHRATMLGMLPFLGGSAIYLYGADDATAYFRALKARDRRLAALDQPNGHPRP